MSTYLTTKYTHKYNAQSLNLYLDRSIETNYYSITCLTRPDSLVYRTRNLKAQVSKEIQENIIKNIFLPTPRRSDE